MRDAQVFPQFLPYNNRLDPVTVIAFFYALHPARSHTAEGPPAPRSQPLQHGSQVQEGRTDGDTGDTTGLGSGAMLGTRRALTRAVKLHLAASARWRLGTYGRGLCGVRLWMQAVNADCASIHTRLTTRTCECILRTTRLVMAYVHMHTRTCQCILRTTRLVPTNPPLTDLLTY